MSVSSDKNGDKDIMAFPGAEDQIDPATFEQILEMDEEDDNSFSKSIVEDFIGQAKSTLQKLESAIKEKEADYLKTSSDLGHFLKGSSATIGLTKVKDSCEKIQHFGHLKDEAGANDISEKEAHKKLNNVVLQAKDEFMEVMEILCKFYDLPPVKPWKSLLVPIE